MKKEFKKLDEKAEDMIAYMVYLLERQENLEITCKIRKKGEKEWKKIK